MTPADEANARALAREILRGPEYARWRELDGRDWVGGVGDGLGAMLQAFLEMPLRHPGWFWAIEITLVVVAAVLLTHVVVSIRAALPASVSSSPPVPPKDARDWLREAETAAARGAFLQASHTLQLGALDTLLRSRRLRLGRSEPNRVLFERLRDADLDEAVRSRLIALVVRLETAWFRDRSDDAALYREWRTLFASLSQGR